MFLFQVVQVDGNDDKVGCHQAERNYVCQGVLSRSGHSEEDLVFKGK